MSVYMRGLERETCAGPNANLSLMRWAGRLGILHIHTQVPEVEDYRIIYTHRCQRCQSVHFHSTPRRQADWAYFIYTHRCQRWRSTGLYTHTGARGAVCVRVAAELPQCNELNQ